MHSSSSRRRRLSGLVSVLASLCVVQAAGVGAARAIEAFDGRFELHGYYELQLRAMARDFSSSDGFDDVGSVWCCDFSDRDTERPIAWRCE